jgi:parallel beta-helix repeat protein
LGDSTASARIVDVRFLDHLGSGLSASGEVTLELERSVFARSSYGVMLDDEVRAVARANQFVENVRHGLELRGNASVELHSDRFVENIGFGLMARGATTADGQGVTFEGNHEGIVAEDDAVVSLRDGTLSRNQVVGAHYRGDARGELRNNTFSDNRFGLVAENASAPRVIGNHFTGHTSVAVRMNCSVVMEDNTFSGNAVDVSGC